MIANFFRNLNEREVDYLLISGQATILYGAATFSEDIDLWLNPVAKHILAFRDALQAADARYYKLTPPLTKEFLKRGHGFHFLLKSGSESEVFLDVLGTPPRVDSFASACAASQWMDTEWGRVRTIGIKDLVELKKTQRLEDYPVVSNLALAWFEQPDCKRSRADYRWALQNIFTLTALRQFFEEHPQAIEALPARDASERMAFGECVAADKEAPDATATKVERYMQQQIAALQQADRRYWRSIIAELKQLRASDKLVSEGAPV